MKKQKLDMINGFYSPFDKALNRLLVNIKKDYDEWGGYRELDLKLKNGQKFIKVVEGSGVWGFVAKVDGEHKGLALKKGDVLKAASWNQAAKYTRGNIFDENQDYFAWTGPNYLK